MKYLDALANASTQYAIMSGRIDEKNEQEVIEFMENTMREAAQRRHPRNGFVYTNNIYAEFARKIVNGNEAPKTMELDDFFDLLDQGLISRHSANKEKCEVFYSLEPASIEEFEKLVEETERRMRMAEYDLEGTPAGFRRIEDAAKVQVLKRRLKMQYQTLNYLSM